MRTNRLIAGLGLLLGLLTMAGGAQGQAQWFNDTFTGTAGSGLAGHVSDSGATWLSTALTNDFMVIGSDNILLFAYNSAKYVRSPNPSKIFYPNVSPSGNEYDLTFPITTGNTSSFPVAVLVRYNPATSACYQFVFNSNNVTAYAFMDQHNLTGTPVTLGNAAITFAANATHTFRIEVRDARKAVYMDGSATPLFASSDNTIASGSIGIVLGGYSNANTDATSQGCYIGQITATYQNTALTAPTISMPSMGDYTTTSVSASRVGILLTNPAGGRPPYSYQWQRGTASGAEANVAGLTAQNAIDSGLTALTLYYYRCVITDANGLTATSNEVSATTLPYVAPGAVVVGWLGDSITGMETSGATYASVLSALTGQPTVVVNCGITSTTTASWYPTSASLQKLIFIMQTCQAKYISIMLGTNDAGVSATSVPLANYQSNLTQIVSTLTGAGFKVVLNNPPFSWGFGGVSTWNGHTYQSLDATLSGYQSANNGLVNNTTVFQGDQLFYADMAGAGDINTTGTLTYDNTHPNAAGKIQLQTRWANALYKAIYAKTGRGRRLN